MEDLEGASAQSDVIEASSEPQHSQQEESTSEVTQSQAETQAKETPFHEHPRWKEVMDERNQYAAAVKELTARLESLERAKPEAPKAADPLVEKLKGIDPDLASRIEAFGKNGETIEQLRQELKEARQERIRETAQSEVNRLFSENKVPESAQRFYKAELIRMANENPKIGVSDLPKMFKEVHEAFGKHFESIRRDDRKSYVNDKKQDAKLPTSQPKGNSAKPAKEKLPMDREAALSSIVKSSLAKFKAAAEA